MKIRNHIKQAYKEAGFTLLTFCDALRAWETSHKIRLLPLKIRVAKNKTTLIKYANNPRGKQPNFITRKAMADVTGWDVTDLFEVIDNRNSQLVKVDCVKNS